MAVCRIYNMKGVEVKSFNTDYLRGLSRIVVGRSSHCDISLKHCAETCISREHFTLTKDGDGNWTIHDTSSRAGLYLNAEKITETRLVNGMVIRFGQLFFGYGDRCVPSRYSLSWQGDGGYEHGALWNGVNSIGASHDNYVMVREGTVSRVHCFITITGEKIVLRRGQSLAFTASSR